ncbi:MAG: PilZ domain-containing protein [Sphingomicrobium sp.]
MAEASSATTFIVGDRLPWPEDVSASQATGPFDSGAIYGADLRRECSIRKISSLGATLRGDFAKVPGDAVSVELGTGQRPAGKVAWIEGGEAGVCFNQPVDMLALINRSLINQPAERRIMPRVEIRCCIHLKWGGHLARGMLRNISANGLQVESDDLPAEGAYVAVHVKGLMVPAGEVVWRKGNLAGIELFEELSWTSIMPWIRETMKDRAQ